MAATVERVLGGVLMLLVLADVFLTVLYARMGTGLLSRQVARGTWKLFRAVSPRSSRGRGAVLSFCGPTIVVVLVLLWALGLAAGAALVIHPALGSGVRAGSGQTPTDFVSALLAGGSSLSIVGAGDFSPHTTGYRLFYLFNSLVGASVLSLTLTYLMQVYTALRSRNTLGLKLHLQSGETADAAELLAGLGPEGQFDGGHNLLSEMAAEMSSTKEGHHFYPVLFYFRFREPFYSVSRFTLVALDTVSLLKAALNDDEHGWLKESASVELLWRASMVLVTSLEDTFHRGGAAETSHPDAATRARWDRRYAAAVRRLHQAGIKTREDASAGPGIYAALRACWDPHIARLAPTMGYEMADIDPAGTHPEASDARPAFRDRRHAPA